MPQLYMVHRRVMNLWFLLLLLLACSTFHTYNHNWPNLRHLPHNLYQIQRCRLMGEPRWISSKTDQLCSQNSQYKTWLTYEIHDLGGMNMNSCMIQHPVSIQCCWKPTAQWSAFSGCKSSLLSQKLKRTWEKSFFFSLKMCFFQQKLTTIITLIKKKPQCEARCLDQCWADIWKIRISTPDIRWGDENP